MSTFTNQIALNTSVNSGLEAMMGGYATAVVEALALEYNFDSIEACKFLDLSGLKVTAPHKEKVVRKATAKRVVPAFLLPFCGEANDGWCQAVQYGKGLFPQCNRSRAPGSDYCKGCMKTGKLVHGSIVDRGQQGWTDLSGKPIVNYGNVLLKLPADEEGAIEEAGKFGWTIPQEQFEVISTKKAKKVLSANDEDAKKRGRPKKSKKVVSGATGDDVIANLMEQAQAAASDSDGSVASEDESVASEEESEAKKVAEEQAKAAEEAAKAAEEAAKAAEEESDAEEEAKKAAEKEQAKAAKEAKKAAEKEQAKAAKEQAKVDKEAGKVAKAAEKEMEKMTKAAEKETAESDKVAAKQAKAEEKASKAEEKVSKKKVTKKVAKSEVKVAETVQEPAIKEEPYWVTESGELSEEEEDCHVTKFIFEGTEYLREEDADGTVHDGASIYDMETQEEIGTWNASTEQIAMY